MPVTCHDDPVLLIHFDAAAPRLRRRSNACHLELPIPLLAGPKDAQTRTMPGAVITQEDQLLLLETPTDLIGAIIVSAKKRLEEPTRLAYLKLLATCTSRQMHVHRVWNYVPDINAVTQGLENYRQFNIGRWMAFEQAFGRDLRASMPAASAVGISSPHVILIFVAGKTQPVYLENPSQVPAYHYPSDYGPRPPGFARAVLIHRDHATHGYLSGTASIEGHQSIGEGNWHQQFRTTLHNISIMLERMGMAQVLKSEAAASAAGLCLDDFRCYLRHPEMLPLLQEWFQEETPWLTPHITYQRADICRAELDLEIEAVLTKRIL